MFLRIHHFSGSPIRILYDEHDMTINDSERATTYVAFNTKRRYQAHHMQTCRCPHCGSIFGVACGGSDLGSRAGFAAGAWSLPT
jgi:hypothetical protein